MEKILLTGAHGYLGACIHQQVRQRGRLVEALTIRLEHIAPRSLDYDYVIHCAGALRHRSDIFAGNVEGTQHLLRGLAQPTPIVYLSSRGVYSLGLTTPLTEESPTEPLDDYGLSKRRAEDLIMESGHPYLILRATTLFGLGVNNLGRSFPAQALHAWQQGQTVTCYTPEREHDYLYVHDLASWILQMAKPGGHWNQIVNVAGQARSLTQLLVKLSAHFQQVWHLPAPILTVPGPPPRMPLMAIDKFIRFFGPPAYTEDDEVSLSMVKYGGAKGTSFAHRNP